MGTIAAVINHAHNEYHQEKPAPILECIEDEAVAKPCFRRLNWLKTKGMDHAGARQLFHQRSRGALIDA